MFRMPSTTSRPRFPSAARFHMRKLNQVPARRSGIRRTNVPDIVRARQAWFLRRSHRTTQLGHVRITRTTLPRSDRHVLPVQHRHAKLTAASPSPHRHDHLNGFRCVKGTLLRRDGFGSGVSGHDHGNPEGLDVGETSWPTLAPSSLHAQHQSDDVLPRNSIDRGYADGDEYRGMVDP